MKKLFVSLLVMLTVLTGVAVMPAEQASAEVVNGYDESCSNNSAFFSLKPWYAGLTVKINGKCEIGAPASKDQIPAYVWTIVLNILFDISVLVGYIAILMVAWGRLSLYVL